MPRTNAHLAAQRQRMAALAREVAEPAGQGRQEKSRLKPELQRLLLMESGCPVDGLPRRNNTSWTRERERKVSIDATAYQYASCVDRSRQADAVLSNCDLDTPVPLGKGPRDVLAQVIHTTTVPSFRETLFAYNAIHDRARRPDCNAGPEAVALPRGDLLLSPRRKSRRSGIGMPRTRSARNRPSPSASIC